MKYFSVVCVNMMCFISLYVWIHFSLCVLGPFAFIVLLSGGYGGHSLLRIDKSNPVIDLFVCPDIMTLLTATSIHYRPHGILRTANDWFWQSDCNMDADNIIVDYSFAFLWRNNMKSVTQHCPLKASGDHYQNHENWTLSSFRLVTANRDLKSIIGSHKQVLLHGIFSVYLRGSFY